MRKTKIPKSGILYDLPEQEYHAHESLSATGAKKILELPALYKHEILDGNKTHKDAFDLGSAVHAKVLGTGWGVKEIKHDSFRSKAAQQERDNARAEGLIPMLTKDLKPIEAMAEAVMAKPIARALFELEGTPETSLFGEADGVRVRCRYDYYPKDHAAVVDLKTTAGSASPRGFAKAAAQFKYHVQEAHYDTTHEAVTGTSRRMVFVVVETKAPYLVGVYQLDRDFLEAGRVEARKARDVYKRCTESGFWPGYADDITLLEMPSWAFWEHNEDFGDQS